MVTESKVPLGTAEQVLLVVLLSSLKGLNVLIIRFFPALKRWAIFSEPRRQIRPHISKSFQTESLPTVTPVECPGFANRSDTEFQGLWKAHPAKTSDFLKCPPSEA